MPASCYVGRVKTDGLDLERLGYYAAHALAWTPDGRPLVFAVDARHPDAEDVAIAELRGEDARVNVRLRTACNINGVDYKPGSWRNWKVAHLEWLN